MHCALLTRAILTKYHFCREVFPKIFWSSEDNKKEKNIQKRKFFGGVGEEKKERKNIFFGGKIFFSEENKRGNIFGEGKGGKYLISGGEEKLRRKIFCQRGRGKRRKIFGEG